MAATVGRLKVELTTTTGRKFAAGFKVASASVKSFAKEVGAAASRLAKFTAGAAAAGVALAAYGTKQSMDAIDSTAKLADRLGIGTEKLIGLRHAAELAGGGAEVLDKSMEQLAKRVGATTITAETADALKEIGLNAKDLMGQDPARNIGKIADGINRLASQERKAAVAAALFGRSGVELLNTLELGSKGLSEMQVEAEKLGLTFSRFDAAKVEEANDAITRMKSVFTGIFNQLAIKLSPLIAEIANRFVAWATSVGGSGVRGVVLDAVDAIGSAISRVGELIDGLSDGWARFRAVTLRTAATVTGIFPKGSIGETIIGGKTPAQMIAEAQMIERDLGRRQGQRSAGGGTGDRIRAFAREIDAAASKRAEAVDASRTMDRIEQLVTAMEKRLAGPSFIEKLTAGPRRMAKELSMVMTSFSGKTPGAGRSGLGARGDGSQPSRLFFGLTGGNSLPSPIASAAGNAGSFGTMGNRLSGAATLQQRALEIASKSLEVLEDIADNTEGGPVLP